MKHDITYKQTNVRQQQQCWPERSSNTPLRSLMFLGEIPISNSPTDDINLSFNHSCLVCLLGWCCILFQSWFSWCLRGLMGRLLWRIWRVDTIVNGRRILWVPTYYALVVLTMLWFVPAMVEDQVYVSGTIANW